MKEVGENARGAAVMLGLLLENYPGRGYADLAVLPYSASAISIGTGLP